MAEFVYEQILAIQHGVAESYRRKRPAHTRPKPQGNRWSAVPAYLPWDPPNEPLPSIRWVEHKPWDGLGPNWDSYYKDMAEERRVWLASHRHLDLSTYVDPGPDCWTADDLAEQL